MGRKTLLVAFVVVLALTHVPVAQERDEAPLDTEVIERTGVSLILIDVFVNDEAGNPMPGLEAKDFTVQLNGIERELYSVDDLCTGALVADAGTADEPVTGEAPRRTSAIIDPPLREPDPVRYILYFDFAQLRQDGRSRAAEEAKRWIREIMQPDEQVLVAAYGFDAGLERFAPYTSDKAGLIATIDEIYEAPRFNDPFPSLMQSRLGECCFPCGAYRMRPECCRGCCPTGEPRCSGYAREEYLRSRASLRTLRNFLELEDVTPGRKVLLLFHQNTISEPARIYSIGTGVTDHISLMDEIGAEATLSSTTMYPIYTGDRLVADFPWVTDYAVNVGANLADFTGGRYNRGTTDLAFTVDRAGRDPACIYRLGIEPPAGSSSRNIFRVKVRVGDRVLPHRYRTRALDETTKWERQARRVLIEPESASDIPLVASIVPSRASLGRWDVKVQVLLDAGSLLRIPTPQGQSGSWEVGALLSNEVSGSAWEMLAVSQLSTTEAEKSSVTVLHEGVVRGVKPGEYELRAFVRDAESNVYGGARTRFELPRPFKPELAGPVVLRAGVPHFTAALPKLRKKGKQNAVPSDPRGGAVPFGDRAVRVGEPLEFRTWICKLQRGASVAEVQRFVARDGEPLFRFEEPTTERAGDCVQLGDRLDTAPMEPGTYTYHVRWERGPDEEPVEASLRFEVEGR